MTAFVASAVALTLIAMLFVLHALWARPHSAASRARSNAGVLRQLAADLERDRALALLTADDYAAARLDLEQRVLADTSIADAPATSRRAVRAPVVLVSIALPAAAVAVYALTGTPHAILNHTTPAHAIAEAASDASSQIARLRTHLASTPGDGRAWVVLARLHMDENRFSEAADAYQQALAASPGKVGKDPLIWCEAADAVALTQGRVLAGKPMELIERALALDPAHPRALEMAGSAAFEARDYPRASALWRQLLAQIPQSAPEHAQLTAALARVERLAKSSLTGTSGSPAR